ncbi:MAG: hypothetical protein H6702_24490 [Myxococcales bacterium]|nr:hypothetical protein [Myxococcales bacterium]
MIRIAALALTALSLLALAPAASHAKGCKHQLEFVNQSGQDVFASYVGMRLTEIRHELDLIKYSDGSGKDFRINNGETTEKTLKTDMNCKWERKIRVKFWCTTGDKKKNKHLKTSKWFKFDGDARSNSRKFTINLTDTIKEKCQ